MHNRILIGLLLGVVAGVSANAFFGGTNPNVEWIVFNITEPIGDLFLRLLLLTVIPLVFSSLVIGVAGIGDIRKLGRIGLKCFVYTLVVSGKQSDPRIGLYSDSPSETAGKVVIRFCHFAPEVPGVDVAAPSGQPIFFTNIGFTQCSQYATIDPGSYNLALWNTGKESTDQHPLFEADGVVVTGGTVNTIIGTGGEGSQPVTAIPVVRSRQAVAAFARRRIPAPLGQSWSRPTCSSAPASWPSTAWWACCPGCIPG